MKRKRKKLLNKHLTLFTREGYIILVTHCTRNGVFLEIVCEGFEAYELYGAENCFNLFNLKSLIMSNVPTKARETNHDIVQIEYTSQL